MSDFIRYDLFPQQYHVLIRLHSCHEICWMWLFYQERETTTEREFLFAIEFLYLYYCTRIWIFITKHRCDIPIASTAIVM